MSTGRAERGERRHAEVPANASLPSTAAGMCMPSARHELPVWSIGWRGLRAGDSQDPATVTRYRFVVHSAAPPLLQEAPRAMRVRRCRRKLKNDGRVERRGPRRPAGVFPATACIPSPAPPATQTTVLVALAVWTVPWCSRHSLGYIQSATKHSGTIAFGASAESSAEPTVQSAAKHICSVQGCSSCRELFADCTLLGSRSRACPHSNARSRAKDARADRVRPECTRQPSEEAVAGLPTWWSVRPDGTVSSRGIVVSWSWHRDIAA